MGTTDYGTQTKTFQYQSEARAKLFNKLLTDLLPVGILSGGTISVASERIVTISSLACLIKANNLEAPDEIFSRIETANTVTLDLSDGTTGEADSSKPYIVLRWEWSEDTENYMDFLAVGWSDDSAEDDEDLLWENDLILGKVRFTTNDDDECIIVQDDSLA